MFCVAVVDDQDRDAEILMSYLKRYEQETGVHFQTTRFDRGLAFLNDTRTVYDIVFMDIEMPSQDGMETATQMRRINSESCLIFVTNLASYAVKGYEVDAMDFLVKPVAYNVFSFKLTKAVARVEKRRQTELTLKLKSGIVRMQVSDLKYVQVEQHRLFYHTQDGVQEAWGSLTQAEQYLKPFGFSKCSGYLLVNLQCVTKVLNDEVWLGEEYFPLSRGRKKEFMADFTKYLGG